MKSDEVYNKFLDFSALAEAGIVLSKLSVDDSSWQKGVKFFPDR